MRWLIWVPNKELPLRLISDPEATSFSGLECINRRLCASEELSLWFIPDPDKIKNNNLNNRFCKLSYTLSIPHNWSVKNYYWKLLIENTRTDLIYLIQHSPTRKANIRHEQFDIVTWTTAFWWRHSADVAFNRVNWISALIMDCALYFPNANAVKYSEYSKSCSVFKGPVSGVFIKCIAASWSLSMLYDAVRVIKSSKKEPRLPYLVTTDLIFWFNDSNRLLVRLA